MVYLGDYIDRGPNAKGVINRILELQKEKVNSIFLMGNHEQIMIDFVFNKINNLSYWLDLGADQTFKSYNIEVAEFIKDGFGDDKIEGLRSELQNSNNALREAIQSNIQRVEQQLQQQLQQAIQSKFLEIQKALGQ